MIERLWWWTRAWQRHLDEQASSAAAGRKKAEAKLADTKACHEQNKRAINSFAAQVEAALKGAVRR